MLPSVNPYTGEVWAEIPEADEHDVRRAVAAATRAFNEGWRQTSGVARAALMLKLAALIEANADRMSAIESADNGKIVRETRPQMLWVGRQLRYFAGLSVLETAEVTGKSPATVKRDWTIAKAWLFRALTGEVLHESASLE